jgi:hypothetical protein
VGPNVYARSDLASHNQVVDLHYKPERRNFSYLSWTAFETIMIRHIRKGMIRTPGDEVIDYGPFERNEASDETIRINAI